jgi:hypothetical protein
LILEIILIAATIGLVEFPLALAWPEGIRDVAISSTIVSNLDATREVTVTNEFFGQGGDPPISIIRPSVPPERSFALYLPADSMLPDGAYAAIVSTNRPLSTLVRTYWFASGGTADYEQAIPSNEIVLPGVVKWWSGRTTVLTVQNTAIDVPATVFFDLRQVDGRILEQGKLDIGAGTSITLDMGRSPIFRNVADSFFGSMHLHSQTPIAVQAFIDVGDAAKGVSAYQGIPVELASKKLFAPMVSAGGSEEHQASESTAIIIANLESEAARFQVHYTRNADPSGDACSFGPEGLDHGGDWHLVGAYASAILLQPDVLPAGCSASAVIESDTPLASVVLITDPILDVHAAYNAFAQDEAGAGLMLPLYRNRQSASDNTTIIYAMNASDEVVRLSLEVTNSSNQPIACGECDQLLDPGETWRWDPSRVRGLQDEVDVFGSARIRSDGPIFAVVNDRSSAGIVDLTSHRAAVLCPGDMQSPGLSKFTCQETNYAPVVFSSQKRPKTPRPPTRIPMASSTPTRVEILPPENVFLPSLSKE